MQLNNRSVPNKQGSLTHHIQWIIIKVKMIQKFFKQISEEEIERQQYLQNS